MTEHRATPEQWAADRYDWARADTEALDGDPAFRCIMELRARVEALEASDANRSDHIGEVNKMVPDGSLVERVAYAITGDDDGPINWKPEASAAIHEVAVWLRSKTDLVYGPQCARWLEQQLDKPLQWNPLTPCLSQSLAVQFHQPAQ